jgi:ABC-type multidrug transport system fused ATPase/permease subunit
MFLFAKYANKIAMGEELVIDEKDDPSTKQCPKCGLRYPDLNRRICPHCMEKGKLFRRFSVFLMRYRVSIIITMISLAVMTALSILAPYLSSGFFYDEVIYGVGEFAGEILLVLGLIIATRLLKVLVTMVNNYITSRIAAKMVFDLKKTIFSAIERLSLSFFTGRQTGGVIGMTVEDNDKVVYAGFITDDCEVVIGTSFGTFKRVLAGPIPTIAGSGKGVIIAELGKPQDNECVVFAEIVAPTDKALITIVTRIGLYYSVELQDILTDKRASKGKIVPKIGACQPLVVYCARR